MKGFTCDIDIKVVLKDELCLPTVKCGGKMGPGVRSLETQVMGHFSITPEKNASVIGGQNTEGPMRFI